MRPSERLKPTVRRITLNAWVTYRNKPAANMNNDYREREKSLSFHKSDLYFWRVAESSPPVTANHWLHKQCEERQKPRQSLIRLFIRKLAVYCVYNVLR